jgi:cytoskeleton protein RodZ
MTDTPPANPVDPAPGTTSAGAMLRAAREAAGLSIDALSQQLKLAPRQVKALEEGDYANLPGRTFVRGFVRNYARAVNLDADAVLAAIPGAVEAPTLERSAIGAAHGPMGELPAAGHARSGSWARWAIPLLLVAAIGAAAVYEYLRPGDIKRGFETRTLPVRPASTEPAAPPAAGTAGATLPDPAAGTPLPNPVAGEPPRPDAPSTAPFPAPSAAPGSDPAPAAGTALPLPTTIAPGPVSTGAIATPALAPAPNPAPAPATAPAAGEATLVIAYRSSSWTEVRDRDGRVVLSVTGTPGTTQTVTGKPPFDLTLGNAGENAITWRGAPFDLSPHLRQNVARVRLP